MKVLTQNEQKILAARTAVDTLVKEGKIFSGMRIGMGTGSTAMPVVSRVADYIKDGTLTGVKAVVTSFQTANACQDLSIPVYTLNDRIIGGVLDLAIDGADEIDPDCNLIKGGGAALLREKIVEYNANGLVIVADSTKAVPHMGTRFALPVEIIGDARVPVMQALTCLGAKCTLREGVRKCGPVITDNGNQILDCVWDEPVNPAGMEDKIDDIPGVVENGFFTKNKPVVFIAKEDGSVEIRR
ncbi:MAG: ribose-5-phosphate isomerase RpiA [Treponema sp.]|nr:ribose-5-phosphate isomerase RpiA [Treponema sp.]